MSWSAICSMNPRTLYKSVKHYEATHDLNSKKIKGGQQ